MFLCLSSRLHETLVSYHKLIGLEAGTGPVPADSLGETKPKRVESGLFLLHKVEQQYRDGRTLFRWHSLGPEQMLRCRLDKAPVARTFECVVNSSTLVDVGMARASSPLCSYKARVCDVAATAHQSAEMDTHISLLCLRRCEDLNHEKRRFKLLQREDSFQVVIEPVTANVWSYQR